MIRTEEVNSLVILKALSLLGAGLDFEYQVNGHAPDVDIVRGPPKPRTREEERKRLPAAAGDILGYVDRRASSVTEVRVGKMVADRVWDLKVSQEPPA